MKRIWLSLCLALCACGSGLQDTVKVDVEDDWTSPSSSEYLGILVTPDEGIVPVGSSVQLEALGLKEVYLDQALAGRLPHGATAYQACIDAVLGSADSSDSTLIVYRP